MSRRTLHRAMSLLESSEKYNIDFNFNYHGGGSMTVLKTTLHMAETRLHVANVH